MHVHAVYRAALWPTLKIFVLHAEIVQLMDAALAIGAVMTAVHILLTLLGISVEIAASVLLIVIVTFAGCVM